MPYHKPWTLLEEGKSSIWVTEDKNPEKEGILSIFSKKPWETRIIIHHNNARRKYPTLIAYHKDGYKHHFPRTGYYMYFFESFGEGSLVRGLYIDHPKTKLNIPDYDISPEALPKESKDLIANIEEKCLRNMVSAIYTNSKGLNKDDILSRFREKSLIEHYFENTGFYKKALNKLSQNKLKPDFIEFLKCDTTGHNFHFFKKKLCQAICLTLDEIVDQAQYYK